MSAFEVNPDHINLLVTAAAHAKYGVAGPMEADVSDNPAAAANALLMENRASVSHRYQEEPEKGEMDYRPVPVVFLEPVTVLKAIACYEYQSCEHPAWESSWAKTFCEELTSAIIHALPGWDPAPWEFVLPVGVQ